MSYPYATRLLTRFATVWVLALAFAVPALAGGKTGDGCSVFYPCGDGYSCQPGVHKCYPDPRQVDQPCSWGYECGSGLTCHPGVHKCYHKVRQEGEPCSAGYECGAGLSCQPGVHVCYKEKRGLGDPCSAGYECGEGLSCQPGVHKCYHKVRQEGEACSAGYECGPGLSCEAFKHVCSKRTKSEMCTEMLTCAFNAAHGQAPVDICSSCGSGGQSVINSITKVLDDPSVATACGAANEIDWLKGALTGGIVSATKLIICQIDPNSGGIDNISCRGDCESSCPNHTADIYLAALQAGTDPDPAALAEESKSYRACQLQCGCGFDKLICEQGAETLAKEACKMLNFGD
jgi:hypothetical protein